MDLRQFRYFVTVAAERNFNKAAERLHMAQPPLSRSIQQLEAEIGAELIDRTSRPLSLTPMGHFFHDQAVQIQDGAAPPLPSYSPLTRCDAYIAP